MVLFIAQAIFIFLLNIKKIDANNFGNEALFPKTINYPYDSDILKPIQNYGCWCSFGKNALHGQGVPKDWIDRLCKEYTHCMRCPRNTEYILTGFYHAIHPDYWDFGKPFLEGKDNLIDPKPCEYSDNSDND